MGSNPVAAYKAPGPDGITWGFYRTAWTIIRGDVLRVVNAFFIVVPFPKWSADHSHPKDIKR